MVSIFTCDAFPLPVPYVPKPAQETYVEISDTELEDPVGASSTTDPGKGETYIILYSFQLACLVVVQDECLILSTLHFASVKPKQP